MKGTFCGAAGTVTGSHFSELVHEAALAEVVGATYSDSGAIIHLHPTLAEGVDSAAGGVHRPSAE